MRILVAEDDPLNVELIEAVFGPAHVLTIVRDGEQALAAAGPFDLIILDINLPHCDGIEICRRLRQRGVTIPVLALSASAMSTDVERALIAGFTEHLSKPISPQRLRSVVLRYARQ